MSRIIIITQAFNAETTLRRTVDSVLNQTYPDFIWYLYDNGSSDETGDIIHKYMSIDARVIGRFILKNDPGHILKHIPEILQENPDADYFAQLDSDDEYAPEFLARTLDLSDRNRLDIAAAGTKFVEEKTNAILRFNTVANDIIIARKEFASRFPEWRPFHCASWAKLFRITDGVRKIRSFAPKSTANAYPFADAEENMVLLSHAQRIGICAGVLHTYYQIKKSHSTHFYPNTLKSHAYTYSLYQDLLCEFGKVSKINADYLSAVWLGWMEDSVRQLATSDLTLKRKQRYAMDILQHPITQQMLNCKPDQQFRNLAERAEFPRQLAEQFDLQFKHKENLKLCQQIYRMLPGCRKTPVRSHYGGWGMMRYA
jgi:glycosyltransferase involved in cell wall biosynthesis